MLALRVFIKGQEIVVFEIEPRQGDDGPIQAFDKESLRRGLRSALARLKGDDPDCRRTKHGVCVRLNAVDASGRPSVRYLVDLERRVPLPRGGASDARPISTGLMVIWFDEPQTPIGACINLQIVLADAARMHSTARLIRPMRGAHIASVRHREAALVQTLASALAAQDQCLTPSARSAAPSFAAKA